MEISPVRVLSPYDFTCDLTSKMESSPNQNWNMHFFNFDRGHLSEPVWRQLKRIPALGGHAQVTLDSYSKYFYNGRPVGRFSCDYVKQIAVQKDNLEDELHQAGVGVKYTGSMPMGLRCFPLWARSHMKYVGSESDTWIGSTDLADESTKREDRMFYLRHPKVAEYLSQISESIFKGVKLTNKRLCAGGVDLLLDGGVIGDSIIYKTAQEIIAGARNQVKIVTPHILDGPIMSRLREAVHRGVDVSIITSDSVCRDETVLERFRIPTSTRDIPFIMIEGKRIHAKAMVVDNKEAIVGSHNLTSKSNYLATRELCLNISGNSAIEPIIQWMNGI